MTFAAMLLFFRNETGFGGNNGFTDFKRILGIPIATQEMRMTLFVLTGLHAAGLLPVRPLAGRAASSAACCRRSATPRRASCSRATTRCGYKLTIWTISAVMCGVAGALYVPQVGIINPGEMSAGQLDRDRDLGGGRRPRHADRADRRRLHRQRRQELADGGRARVLAVLPGRAVHRASRCSCRTASSAWCKKLARARRRAKAGARRSAPGARAGVEPARAMRRSRSAPREPAHDARPDGSGRARIARHARPRPAGRPNPAAAPPASAASRRRARSTSRTAASCTWKT